MPKDNFGGTYSTTTLTSGYGTGLTTKQKNAVNIIQTPFIDIGETWGTGVVGSGAGNKAYRQTDAINGLIITEIHIDLQGLTAKGGDAGDAIGTGTTPAYIYRNVTNDNGVIFKHELICTELPASTTGTITTDINVAWNSSGNIDFDEAVGTASEINTGGLVAGQVVVDETAAITNGHYAYLTEGDTAASNGNYTSGQYIYRMYGYKVRT
tara:strand:- start:29 stop:658 length:630 start_codon:yes stop_codon:yes gene_type:complete